MLGPTNPGCLAYRGVHLKESLVIYRQTCEIWPGGDQLTISTLERCQSLGSGVQKHPAEVAILVILETIDDRLEQRTKL